MLTCSDSSWRRASKRFSTGRSLQHALGLHRAVRWRATFCVTKSGRRTMCYARSSRWPREKRDGDPIYERRERKGTARGHAEPRRDQTVRHWGVTLFRIPPELLLDSEPQWPDRIPIPFPRVELPTLQDVLVHGKSTVMHSLRTMVTASRILHDQHVFRTNTTHVLLNCVLIDDTDIECHSSVIITTDDERSFQIPSSTSTSSSSLQHQQPQQYHSCSVTC